MIDPRLMHERGMSCRQTVLDKSGANQCAVPNVVEPRRQQYMASQVNTAPQRDPNHRSGRSVQGYAENLRTAPNERIAGAAGTIGIIPNASTNPQGRSSPENIYHDVRHDNHDNHDNHDSHDTRNVHDDNNFFTNLDNHAMFHDLGDIY